MGRLLLYGVFKLRVHVKTKVKIFLQSAAEQMQRQI